MIMCIHGHGKHPDSPRIADPGRITDPGGFANSALVDRAGGVTTNGGRKMTTNTVNEPVTGYDGLKTKEVVASLSSRSQVELTAIASYEHTHENRVSVFDKLRWLRQDEPLPGYDALSSEQLLAALEKADLAGLKRVRSYERKFRARREVLEEVDRLHRERRVPLVSRDAQR
jgi:hypothetical protein